MTPITETAKEAARKAGDYLMLNFGGQIASTDKESHHSIVTGCDMEAERILIEAIKAQYPGHSILSEETGLLKQDSEFLWVIDPLDGSSYFARGINTFSVAVGVIKNKEIVSTAIFCPAQNEMFYAEKGTGAFMNGKKISVSGNTDLKQCICSVGHRYLRLPEYDTGMRKLLKAVRSIRGGGSCAQELCYLACGRIDILLTVNQSFWDYAAGALILEEAGGKITDIKGEGINFDKHMQGKFNLLATNNRLHTDVLKLI